MASGQVLIVFGPKLGTRFPTLRIMCFASQPFELLALRVKLPTLIELFLFQQQGTQKEISCTNLTLLLEKNYKEIIKL